MAKSTARKNLSIDTKDFTIKDYALKKPDAYKPKSTATVKKQASAKLGAKVDPSKKKSPKPVAKASAIGAVAKRFNVTAKEARDIARAVGNVAESFVASKNVKTKSQQYYGGQALKASVKDLKKQVKETGKAATTGKKGTPAGKLKYDVDTGAPFGLRKAKERQNFIQ
jgi:hypothetical protein